MDRRPVLLLPRLPPYGTPLSPGSQAAIRLATWCNGAITKPCKGGTHTVDYFWKKKVVTHATIHDVFDVQCIPGPGRVDSNVRVIAGRRALRELVPILDGRVVILCGRAVEHIVIGLDAAPYGAVRMVNLNARHLVSRVILGDASVGEFPPVLCTTVLAPHPSRLNQPAIVQSPHQAKRLEFGYIYRRAITLKHQPPRTLV